MKTPTIDTPGQIDTNGEWVAWTPEQMEQLRLQRLNTALLTYGQFELEKLILAEMAPEARKLGDPATMDHHTAAQLATVRRDATIRVAERIADEIDREREAKLAEAEAGADVRARERVLRNFRSRLNGRLATMPEGERSAWQTEVTALESTLEAARSLRRQDEVDRCTARLAELGALPPAEDDLEALFAADVAHPCGVSIVDQEAEHLRLRAKHNLGPDNKPKGRRK